MKSRPVTLSAIFLSLSFIVSAQVGPVIQFEKNVHDFGLIKEEANDIVTDFKFKNVGDQPLVISDVQAACGCTTPGWTTTPVMPGKSGYVRAAFNPRNRPGGFNKSLNVTSNSVQTPVITLFIKGSVEPRVKSMEELYPTQLGKLRVRSTFISYGAVMNNKTETQSMTVFNSGNTPIKYMEGNTVLPDFVKVKVEPNPIPPLAEGVIAFDFDFSKKNDFGYVREKVVLFTNEPSNAKKEFWLTADVKAYLPERNASQMATAPRMAITKAAHDFGKISQGSVVTHEFELKNEGKEDLVIYKVKPNCGCITTGIEATILKPGEKTLLKLSYQTAGRSGGQSHNAVVYTNDPRDPEQRVFINALIE